MTEIDTSRRVTIRDVADAAGVAPSTVSRALSLPDRVNRVTQQRIQDAARELGYVPNSQARALTSGRTRAVAVLVSDITNPFYFDVIRGTQHQLAAAGWTQLLVDTEESADAEMAALSAVSAKADGVVLTASRLSDTQIARYAERTPLVVVNRRPAGVPSVLIDTPGGVEQAVQHLVSLGHRDVLYVAGPDSSWSNERRWKALVQVAKRLDVRVARIGPHAPFVDSGAAAADAAVNVGATACIAFNDLIAIGMLGRLRERGVRVPEDMSIVGCDDIFGADFCNPPLTTMTSPIERAGRVAITMLLGRLGALPAEQFPGERMRGAVALPTHLTVRESTGPAPGLASVTEPTGPTPSSTVRESTGPAPSLQSVTEPTGPTPSSTVRESTGPAPSLQSVTELTGPAPGLQPVTGPTNPSSSPS